MYVFNFEHVSKVKVSEEAWEDPKIREVLFQYIITIRMFMAFRTMVTLWGSYLEEGDMKNYLCAFQFYFDVYLLTMMCVENFVRPTHKVLVHRDIKMPVSLQSSLVIVGIYCFLKAKNYI